VSGRPVPPQRGDEEELFVRYQPRLRRHVRIAVRTTPEIVDDACAFAWMKFVACQPRRETTFAWLCTVARNEAVHLDRLSRERISRERPLDLTERAADGVQATRGRVEIATQFIELRDRLLELPPRQREAVLLHAAGWRFGELAEHLGISPSRVTHLFDRGVQRMREIDQRDEEVRSPRGRRLREVENDPPRYIRAALGRQPTGHAKEGKQAARREWQRLVLQIEDYRAANGVTDQVVALGRGERVPPADLIARRIASYRRDRGLGMGIEL
jgi:RNA polymerase sigma factor (sigma-70 family)